MGELLCWLFADFIEIRQKILKHCIHQPVKVKVFVRRVYFVFWNTVEYQLGYTWFFNLDLFFSFKTPKKIFFFLWQWWPFLFNNFHQSINTVHAGKLLCCNPCSFSSSSFSGMKAVCGWYLLVWMDFTYRWWRLFRSFLTFLSQPFSLITDPCPPLILHHCPLREGKVKLSLWNLKHLLLRHAWERNKPFYHIVETLTSRLINAEPCVKMVVRNFFARRTIDKWGPLIFESPLFISPPFFFTFSSCLQRRGGRRIHWKTTQLENGGVFWLKDLLLTQDDDVIWAVHPCAAEQHWLWAALLWLTKDDPVGGARVPPTGSAPQHSQEVIKMHVF